MCFSLLLKNCTFAARNLSSRTVLLPRWLKKPQFYRELNFLDPYRRSFSIFHLFPVKTINIYIYAWKREILEKKINLILFFNNLKNEISCSAPSLCKLNTIIHLVLSIKLKEKIDFLQDPQKAYIFYAYRFLYVLQKSLETNYVRDLMILIFC